MSRKILAAALAGVSFLGVSSDTASNPASLISEFVRFYQSGEFAKAAQLFHCPPSYTPAELEADRKDIEGSLRIMSDLYGPVKGVSESAASVYVAPTTACGTAEYWKANPTTAIHILNTEQAQAEHGYLVFQFASVGGQAVLFQFGHGLPATHREARARAQLFLQRKLAK